MNRLHYNIKIPNYKKGEKEICKKDIEMIDVPIATEETRHHTYSTLLSMLCLTTVHKDKLLARGLTQEQIIKNEYRSTPVFGFKNLTKKIIERGLP